VTFTVVVATEAGTKTITFPVGSLATLEYASGAGGSTLGAGRARCGGHG
jgi:hypothetical protein